VKHRNAQVLDPGRAVRDGRPADLLLRLGCGSGGRGHAGSLLTEALSLLADCEGWPHPPLALVFGTGGSVEVLELLRRGWIAVAFDQAATKLSPAARLTIERTDPQVAVLPPADLIYTEARLPFRPPDEFAALWGRIVRALRPGGWFVGHLLGDRDGWADDPDVTAVSRDQAIRLLAGFRIEVLGEKDESGLSSADSKRWHLFQVVARRRPLSSRGRTEWTPRV
jgi:hypothetical protein